MQRFRSLRWLPLVLPTLCAAWFLGCKSVSQRINKMLDNKLARWNMLPEQAVEDPLAAVGGDGIVFAPGGEDRPLPPARLETATPQELVSYYAPVFVQQRVNPAAKKYPYPPEYDEIGEARLKHDAGGKLKALVAGPPRIYAIYQKKPIGGHDHVQLTYTAWYPAHPRMKLVDLEEADIDSCVVRVTLDARNAPIFFETIAACGCFHKVFVERRIEEGARQVHGAPEKDQKFCVARNFKDDIDWEVAGVVNDPADRPRRPVVFLNAGDHKVLGMGSAAHLRVPPRADVRPYQLGEYAELYSLPVAGGHEHAPFFDLGQGGKVWGAERKERFLFTILGVDDAGHPRANAQIKMHFDQADWDDATTYERFLRLAPGTL
jgi:hypothetical protein